MFVDNIVDTRTFKCNSKIIIIITITGNYSTYRYIISVIYRYFEKYTKHC